MDTTPRARAGSDCHEDRSKHQPEAIPVKSQHMIGNDGVRSGEEQGSEGVPTVAAFDFDGTITRGGSTVRFLVWVRGYFPVAFALLRNLPRLLYAMVAGGTAADRAKEALFNQLLRGLTVDQLQRAGVAFAEHHLRRQLRPEVVDRLDWHRRQGHHVVLVSASLEYYVEPAGAMLAVDGVLGTRLVVDGSGNLTGRIDGKNCRGAEKYARVVGWLRQNGLAGTGVQQPLLWAYGNSRGDLWLLNAADRAFDTGRLGRFGRLRHFPRLRTATRQRHGVPVARGSA